MIYQYVKIINSGGNVCIGPLKLLTIVRLTTEHIWHEETEIVKSDWKSMAKVNNF